MPDHRFAHDLASALPLPARLRRLPYPESFQKDEANK
jgi:hypothetical protein